MRNSILNTTQVEEARGVITLKSVFRQTKTTVMPIKKGNWYLGIPRLSPTAKLEANIVVDEDSKCKLFNGITFDLSDEFERATWEWVKHSSVIAETEEECQFNKLAEFYIDNEIEKLAKEVNREEFKIEAYNLIKNDSQSGHAIRAELLGVDMYRDHPDAVKSYLYSVANKSPEKVLQVYKSEDLSYRILLKTALKKNVIIKDVVTGYYQYGNTILGMQEETVINWLRDAANKAVVEVIQNEANPVTISETEPRTLKTKSPKSKK